VDSPWSVQVERLAGDEINVFSLTTINQALPAEPKSLTPIDEAGYMDQTRLLIPYNFRTSKIVSTASRNYVFYASNPDMEVFSAYFEYCSRPANSDTLGKFGLLIKSSYSPIRIYRVSAYRRCGAYSCGPDLVKSQTIPGFIEDFSRKCDQNFTVQVSALEYLNEENIAVTLLVSSVNQFISETGTWKGVYKTVWLNPSTMNIQENIWQEQLPSTFSATLCPAMQRMPRLGTFLAEVINSGIFGIKFVMFTIIYTPGMVKVWSSSGGTQCPIVPAGTYFHLVLANCGNDLFSLDDFFDSLEDASSVFWHSLTAIGDLVTPNNMKFASPIQDVLAGMSQYGEGTIDIWTQRASVQTLTSLPIANQLVDTWGFIRSGGLPIQGASHIGSGMIAWSRYCYRASMEISMALVKDLLSGTELTFDYVWTRIWGLIYDLQDYYVDTVKRKTSLSCAGLRLMFGSSNPWADVIYYQCLSGSELTNDLIRMVLTIFVDAPMIKCICKDAVGVDPTTFAINVCAPRMPLSLRPKIYMIANQIQGSSSSISKLQCTNVVEMTKSMIASSFDGWFQNQLLSLDALGDSVNYFMDITDSQSGRCLDFHKDPHVVVLVPWPVDYFQRCSKTSLCKTICESEWNQFKSVLNSPVPLPSMTVASESLFFPGQLDTSLMLNNVTASTEVSPVGVCTPRAKTIPSDFSLALAEFADNMIGVQVWCIPQMASASVYRIHSKGFSSQTLPGSLLSVRFGDTSGTWLVLMIQVGGSPGVFLLDSSGLTQTPPVEPHLPFGNYIVRIGDMW